MLTLFALYTKLELRFFNEITASTFHGDVEFETIPSIQQQDDALQKKFKLNKIDIECDLYEAVCTQGEVTTIHVFFIRNWSIRN